MSNQITPNPSVPTQVVQELKFPKFINNLGIIPTSYKDSMSYYECLAWLCKFIEETVIPTVNENGEAVEELQGLFVELNSYVANYFDNLDVQEEINNKLDDMVEQGTLQEIIADYLNSKAVFGFDSVDDMKNATNLINGSYAKTLGFYESNDGGSALYKIRKITNDDVIDEMTIIEMNDEENDLIAELIINDSVLNFKQVGGKGDKETDNTTILTKAIAVCKAKKLSLFFPIGTYNVNGTFNIDFSLKMYGEHVGNTVGTWGGADSPSLAFASVINDVNNTQNNPEYYLFSFSNYNRGCVEISDLVIKGNNNNHSCLNLLYAGWTFYIKNVTIDNFVYKGINCSTLYDSNILNLTVERCGKAKYEGNPQYAIYMSKNLVTDTNTNALHFTHLHMEFCRYYIDFDNAQDISFSNCKFEISRNTNNHEEIGHVDTDIDNPHFIFNSENDTRVIFTNSTFCFRGIKTWLDENPSVSDLSTLPFGFKTVGSATNEACNISFIGCTIFSPLNDGGFKCFSNNGNANVVIADSFLYNLALRSNAFYGNKFDLTNNRMRYYVHSSVETFTGVGSTLNNSIISNNIITVDSTTIGKCTNNAINGFVILNIDQDSIWNGNKFTNFKNMPLIYYNETVKTFNSESGTALSQDLTVPKSGKCVIKLHLNVPSGGNAGRLYIKLATTSRPSNVNLLMFQSDIPNNTCSQDFYIIESLRESENLRLELLQNSGTSKTITGTFTFNYS